MEISRIFTNLTSSKKIKYREFLLKLKCLPHLEYIENDVELVLSQYDVVADLTQTVDGVQSHRLNLVVKHIDHEVLRETSEARRLGRQFTQRVQRRVAHLCRGETFTVSITGSRYLSQSLVLDLQDHVYCIRLTLATAPMTRLRGRLV